MKKKRIVKKIAVVCLLTLSVCALSGCSDKKSKEITSPLATPTGDSILAVPDVTISDKVDESVINGINFEEYEYKDSSAYKLSEKETSSKIKLTVPTTDYSIANMKGTFHVDIVNKDDGRLVLELLGTDFTLPQGIKTCEVKWKSMGIFHTSGEKLYRFINLCIELDGSVYFYENTFYSPIIEGRMEVVEPITSGDK